MNMKLNDTLSLAGISEDVAKTFVRAVEGLKNPQSLVDSKQIADLQATIKTAKEGSIEALAATLALAKVRVPDTSGIEQEAVSSLRAILKAIPLSEDAAKALGVPQRIVDQAMRNTGNSSAPSKPRARRTSAAEIEAAILATKGSFKISDIEVGSSASVTKVVKDLVIAKKVTEEGPDPKHSGRGRAPNLFSVLVTKK